MFHYVQIKTDEEDRPIKLVVKETFGGFTEQDSQKSESLENMVNSWIEEFSEV